MTPTKLQCAEIARMLEVLETIVRDSGATESNPLAIGNVKFWIDPPTKWNGFCPQMAYDIPASQWDKKALTNLLGGL